MRALEMCHGQIDLSLPLLPQETRDMIPEIEKAASSAPESPETPSRWKPRLRISSRRTRLPARMDGADDEDDELENISGGAFGDLACMRTKDARGLHLYSVRVADGGGE